ncbi:hypothetical protein BJV78DRAFT_1156599 [Lactifluus subvellereus]|nr:hypothetical protein BJV78DRAFT_1156599 [Lactifluus subvellereus]
MALVEPQQANHLPENTFPRPLVPQRHDRVQQSARILPATGDGQCQVHVEDNSLPVEKVPIQDQVQHLRYLDRARYNGMDYVPLPQAYPAVPNNLDFNNHAGLVHDVGAQAEALMLPVPEIQGNDIFAYIPQDATAGLHGAFPDARPDQAPTLGPPGAEILRRLASYYLHHPNAQVDMVRMEPGPAGRFKMMIMLEMADFF